MNYPTLPQALLEALERYPNPRLLLHKAGDHWKAMSSAEFLQRIAAFSRAFVQLGLSPADRVAILSGNRPEWHIADFAVLGAGGVSVPIYFRESPERMAGIVSDSGAKILFAAGEDQVALAERTRDRLEGVQYVIAAGTKDHYAEFLDYETLSAGGGAEEIENYCHLAEKVSSSDLATLIYTSGTTGEPKGVMLTHANLTSNALDTFRSWDFVNTDQALSFLPLAHVYERMFDYGCFFTGISIAYVEQVERVQEALLEVHPTIAAAVPRLFEKTYATIIEKTAALRGIERQIFQWAMKIARAAVPWKGYGQRVSPAIRLAWSLADRIVYRKIRDGVGGRIRCFASGSAPLEKELAEFFWSVGIPVYEGYGLTETSPVVSANLPKSKRLGTVGRPIPNVEVRIAEDGEILVRGACIMQGYYKRPEDTREAFLPDGFLRTGDIGEMDRDGYLKITDRKRELLKTAAGKYIAPQPIENRLKTSSYITNAVVVGDRRKFASLLIVPNFAALRNYARDKSLPDGSDQEISAQSWTRNLITGEVDRLTADLAQYEKPKRFAILGSEFSFENGELTYTLKLRRKMIEQRYGGVIEQLYADVEEPLPPAASR